MSLGRLRPSASWGGGTIIALSSLLLWCTPVVADAATLYWVGASGESTGTASNWGTTNPSGCGGGDASSAPGVSDTAVFDADCDNSAAIDILFNVADLTLQSGYTGTVTQSVNITIGALNISGGTFTGSSSTLDVNGSVTLTSGTLTAPSGTFTISGDWTKTGGTFTSGSNTVTFDGTSTQTLTSGGTDTGSDFNNLTVNKSSGTLSLATNALDVDGTLTLSSGTFSSGSLDVIAGALTVSGGTFTTGAGDVDVNGTVTISSGALTISDVMTVSGDWTKSGGTFTAASGTLVTLDGSSDQTLTSGGTDTGSDFYQLQVNKSSGTLSLATNALDVDNILTVTSGTFSPGSLDITLRGLTVSGGTFTGGSGAVDLPDGSQVLLSAGTLTAPSGTFTISGNWTKSGGTFTSGSNTVTFNGTGDQSLNSGGTDTGSDFNNLTVNKSSGTLSLSTNALDVDGTFTLSSGTFSPGSLASTAGTLTVSGGTLTGGSGALDVNGTMTLSSGTLTAPSGTFTVSGNWTNSGGTFTPGSNTVTFDGTSQTVTGATSFYNLSKTEGSNDSTDETLTFTASTTFTITNTLTLDGRDDDDRINLVSSTNGTRFTLNVTGAAQSVDYLDVRDSNASSNNITCTNCTNTSNNDDGEAAPHWVFGSGGGGGSGDSGGGGGGGSDSGSTSTTTTKPKKKVATTSPSPTPRPSSSTFEGFEQTIESSILPPRTSTSFSLESLDQIPVTKVQPQSETLDEFSGRVDRLAKLRTTLKPFANAPVVRTVNALSVPAAAIALAASSSAFTAVPGIMAELPLLLSRVWSTIGIFLSFRRRQRPWGRVLDASTGVPVQSVSVSVVDHETQRVRDVVFSNADGAFAPLLPPGTYDFRIAKPGWTLATSAGSLAGIATEHIYTGQSFTLTEEGLVSVVVLVHVLTVVPDIHRRMIRLFAQRIEAILLRISWPIFFLGIGVNSLIVFVSPSRLNIAVEVFYIFLGAVKLLLTFRKTRTVGSVIDDATGTPLALATLRLYDTVTGRLVLTRVTDHSGKFVLLPSPGTYKLTIVREGYEAYQDDRLVVRSAERSVAFDISLIPIPPKQMAVQLVG